MCIIVISETKPLELASFVDFAKYNQDGAGIMVARNGKVHTHVTLEGPEAVYAKYIELYRTGDPMFLHYRMKTHGAIDLANTHPYLVYRHENGKELWMMHNGILRTGNAGNPAMSDTWNFIQQRLQALTRDFPKWFLNEDLIEWLGDFIGNNRFVFLDSDGDYNIVNAGQWSTHDEHCYSNEYAWSAPKKWKAPTYPASTWKNINGVWTNTAVQKPQTLHTKTWEDDGYYDGMGYQHLNQLDLDAEALAAEYYDEFEKELNAALPASASKTWTALAVQNLEYFISLRWFVDALKANEYSAAECDALLMVLNTPNGVPLTGEQEDKVEDILYERFEVAGSEAAWEPDGTSASSWLTPTSNKKQVLN